MNTTVLRRIGAAAAVLVVGAGMSACAGDDIPPVGGPDVPGGSGAGPVDPGPGPAAPESTLYGDGVHDTVRVEAFDGTLVGVSGSGEMLEGDEWNGRLVVDERSAVVLGAFAEEEDMVIEISGNGVDQRFDDSSDHLDLFGGTDNVFDAAAVTVLDAGVYDLTFSEYSGDATAMEFELLSGTAQMDRFGSTSVDLPEDSFALAIVDVDSGPALVSADSPDIDPILHVVGSDGSSWSNDDNEIGLSNWRAAAIESGNLVGPAVAIVESYSGAGGFVTLVVT
ncbi:hypothetical protein ACPYO6_07245 [Georgenia sp. Z1344]|uniref:hypothetical protein n=1 Tax=Georgenia sp. Z1344 TaxID=3416706 RepID=UPI003CEAA271